MVDYLPDPPEGTFWRLGEQDTVFGDTPYLELMTREESWFRFRTREVELYGDYVRQDAWGIHSAKWDSVDEDSVRATAERILSHYALDLKRQEAKDRFKGDYK